MSRDDGGLMWRDLGVDGMTCLRFIYGTRKGGDLLRYLGI